VTPEAHESEAENGFRIRLFDADRTDRKLSFDEAIERDPSKRQLLWIDVEGNLDPELLGRLIERFNLNPVTGKALASPGGLPRVQLHGTHFYLRAAAEPDAMHPEQMRWIDVVAGSNVVITRHDDQLELLGALNARIAEDASIGELDSPEFVASLLDAIVTSYHAAVDSVEDELDEFDTKALGQPTSAELSAQLVGIRRRVGRLRRLLAAHREMFGSLSRPDFARGVESADPEVFLAVTSRFDAALVSVESTREVVLASFDVLMTRTAQRTNEVMRVLTLATVLFLPATVTAGFLGMNVIVPVPNDDPMSFWLILGAILVFEAAAIVIAKVRGWI
jgi:magnesium transporter